METKILKSTKLAAKIIENGGLVAFPTETVYGLGADCFNEAAVENIFKAKNRPSDNPLILHISSLKQLYTLTENVSKIALELIEKFWPGPLTLIFKKHKNVDKFITRGLETVAVRMPKPQIAREFISLSKTIIAAPSANLSGRPSPTRFEHVLEDLNGRIDAVLTGKPAEIGLESTVVDVSTNAVEILRPGFVTLEDIYEVTGVPLSYIRNDIEYNSMSEVKSPGMKYKHYAPDAEIFIIKNINCNLNKLIEKNNKKGLKTGLLLNKSEDIYDCDTVFRLGFNFKDMSANFFDILRRFEKENTDIIYVEDIEDSGIGHAIMDRLKKAAGFKYITLESGS